MKKNHMQKYLISAILNLVMVTSGFLTLIWPDVIGAKYILLYMTMLWLGLFSLFFMPEERFRAFPQKKQAVFLLLALFFHVLMALFFYKQKIFFIFSQFIVLCFILSLYVILSFFLFKNRKISPQKLSDPFKTPNIIWIILSFLSFLGNSIRNYYYLNQDLSIAFYNSLPIFLFIYIGNGSLWHNLFKTFSINKLRDTPFVKKKLFWPFLLKLHHVNTFIFSYEKILTQSDFQLARTEHRKTMRSDTVKKVFSALFRASAWNMVLQKLPESDPDFNFDILEKNDALIRVKDTEENQYLLSLYPLNSDQEERQDFSFFLYKDDILIGQFLLKQKYSSVWDDFLSKIHNLYNIALFSKVAGRLVAPNIPLYYFDKLYGGLSSEEQVKHLQQLEERSETLLISAHKCLTDKARLSLLIGDQTDEDKLYLEEAPKLLIEWLIASKHIHSNLNTIKWAISFYNISMLVLFFLGFIGATSALIAMLLVTLLNYYFVSE